MKKIFMLYIALVLSCQLYAQDLSSVNKEAQDLWKEGIGLLDIDRNKGFSLLLKSLDLSKDSLEDDQIPEYVNSCLYLGRSYMKYGMYEETESLYLSTIEWLNNKGYYDADLYNSLGKYYYQAIGDKQKSLYYLNKAKEVFEERGIVNNGYFRTLISMGAIYHGDDNLLAKIYYDVARSVIQNYDEIDNFFGDVINLYHNLALLYYDLGINDEAIKVLSEVIEMCDDHFGIELNKLRLLSDLEYIKGDEKTEMEYLKKVNNINNGTDSRLHDFMRLIYLEFFLCDKDLLQDAILYSNEFLDDIVHSFSYLTEANREIYVEEKRYDAEALKSILVSGFVRLVENGSLSDKEILDLNFFNGVFYNNELLMKGILLRTIKGIKYAVYNKEDKEGITLLKKIEDFKAALSLDTITDNSRNSLKDSIDYYDRKMMHEVISYESLKQVLAVEWNDIKDCLLDNEVALEFVKVPYIAFDSVSYERNVYFAIVLNKDSRYPEIEMLCRESDLEEIMLNKGHLPTNRFINNLYRSGNPRITYGEKLYQYVWEPIDKYLNEGQTVYYSPSGILNSLSFNAISHESKFLCERYDLRMVSSTSEIVRKSENDNLNLESSVVYGGIEYDVSALEMKAESSNYISKYERDSSYFLDSLQVRSGWSYLAGTEEEAKSIYERLVGNHVPVSLMKGIKANEESFKSFDGNSPSLIHIATHGFFLSDPKEAASNPSLKRLGVDLKEPNNTSRNSLIRSGLLFAGANRAWIGEDSLDGVDDGILTAEEVSKIDLSNTDLVVLSACETGLGEIISSEGVFGLQRAFKLAGVQTLIMSLWKVPDAETSKLMVLFYENLLSGQGKHDAFRNAQIAIKEEYSSPYYWAGFVMLD